MGLLTVVLALLLLVSIVFPIVYILRGKLTLDLGWGRTFHDLGPIELTVDAPRELVYQTIAGPYLGRTPKQMRDHLNVIEQGDDYALAAHYTDFPGYTAETVELVEFEEPEEISFRHLRGPVPHAVEAFSLTEADGDATKTEFAYTGEIGIDYWAVGSLLARTWVIPWWEDVVRTSMENTKEIAERRAEARARRGAQSDYDTEG